MSRFSSLAAAALLLALPLAAAAQTAEAPLVETSSGTLRGVAGDGVYEFLGVPYARPPVGPLRFQAPAPLARSDDTLDATRYGEAAVQMPAGAGAASYPPEIGAAMAEAFAPPEGIAAEGAEDSLVLNVYTPSIEPGDDARPVMVWLHGGGFSYGQAGSRIYRGTNLARNHDVVVVGVNHRLNVFGFLALDTAGVPGFEGSANAGMLDIVAALEWVEENIDRFGGDPGNVTIFGQSGGGAKVSTLMAMPKALGLFHKAIVQSGAGLEALEADEAAATALGVLEELGIAPEEAAERLPDVPVADVLAAAYEVGARGFRPSVDGAALPRHPFAPDAPEGASDVPLMIGYTKDERTLYNVGREAWYETDEAEALAATEEAAPGEGEALLEAYRAAYPDYDAKYLLMQVEGTTRHLTGAHTLAARKAEQPAGVYAYVFAHDLPPQDGLLKSPHTAEIPYVFDNVAEAPLFAGDREADRTVEDLTSDAWVRFARTGDPGGEGLPDWPRFDAEERPTMILSAEPRLVTRPLEAVWQSRGE